MRNVRRSRTAPRAGFLRAQVATVLASALVAMLGAGDDRPSRPRVLSLFDGKTLNGWKATELRGAGKVMVDGGAIVLSVGEPMTGITCTRNDLPTTNYELTYQAMRREGDDFFAAATFPVGTSFVTLVNGGWGGTVTGLSSLNGADASENATNQAIAYKNNTWYRFRVVVTDTVVRGWVDDRELFALEREGQQFRTRIETRKNEPLGFATWKTAGAVRNVEIRALTPAEVAAVKAPE